MSSSTSVSSMCILFQPEDTRLDIRSESELKLITRVNEAKVSFIKLNIQLMDRAKSCANFLIRDHQVTMYRPFFSYTHTQSFEGEESTSSVSFYLDNQKQTRKLTSACKLLGIFNDPVVCKDASTDEKQEVVTYSLNEEADDDDESIKKLADIRKLFKDTVHQGKSISSKKEFKIESDFYTDEGMQDALRLTPIPKCKAAIKSPISNL